MRIYTVHEGPGARDAEGTVFIPEGFAFWALAAPWAWLAFKRLWLAFALVLAALIAIAVVEASGLLNGQAALGLNLAISVFTGLEGRNWQRGGLARRGFKEAGMVAARNLAEAEARWFAPPRPVVPATPRASASLMPWPGASV